MKIESAEFIRSALSPAQFIDDGRPEIAFVGRSNVGKSSLLNRLLGRKGLAKTSSTPGRTQAVNYFLVNRKVYFVDLPGYGYARAPKAEREKWSVLMAQYFSRWALGSPLLQLVDGKVGATDLDETAYDYFTSLGISPLLVATKIDKLPRSRRIRGLRAIRERLQIPEQGTLIPFSSTTGEGIREIWKQIQFLLDNYEKPQRTEST